MPLEDDEFVPRDAEELNERAAETADEIYGDDLELTDGSLVSALIGGQSETLADTLQPTLEDLYTSSFIATATGQSLTRRADDLGVSRRPSIAASGIVTFERDSEPLREYVVPSGTVIETSGRDPISFETVEKGSVRLFDGFEDGSLDGEWNGDRSSFTVQSNTVDDDEFALEVNPVEGTILRDDTNTARGDALRTSIWMGQSRSVGFLYHATDPENAYRIAIDSGGDAVTVENLENGAVDILASRSTTIPTESWLTIGVNTTINGDDTVRLFDGEAVVAEMTVDDDSHSEGQIGVSALPDGSANGNAFVDTLVRTKTTLNIEGLSGGSETNVVKNSITTAPSPPTGITDLYNPVSTGDSNSRDTDGNRFTVGVDRETDDELRDRVREAKTIGGTATVPAIDTGLVEKVDDVISVRIFENDTLEDNTDSGGLPPLSIEPIVYGGASQDVAEALHNLVAATERVYSGAYGESDSATVQSDVLADDETYEFSRPSSDDIELELDLRVRSGYVGDAEIESIVVNYVGGTTRDGTDVRGLGIGEVLYVDELRDRLVGSDTGVVGVASTAIDGDGDGNDDTTTVNGLRAYDVDNDAVAVVDLQSEAISITTEEI